MNPKSFTQWLDQTFDSLLALVQSKLAYPPPAPFASTLTFAITKGSKHMTGTVTAPLPPTNPPSPITAHTITPTVNGTVGSPIDFPLTSTTLVIGTTFNPGDTVGYSETYTNSAGVVSSVPFVFAPVTVPPPGVTVLDPPTPLPSTLTFM